MYYLSYTTKKYFLRTYRFKNIKTLLYPNIFRRDAKPLMNVYIVVLA